MAHLHRPERREDRGRWAAPYDGTAALGGASPVPRDAPPPSRATVPRTAQVEPSGQEVVDDAIASSRSRKGERARQAHVRLVKEAAVRVRTIEHETAGAEMTPAQRIMAKMAAKVRALAQTSSSAAASAAKPDEAEQGYCHICSDHACGVPSHYAGTRLRLRAGADSAACPGRQS